ARPSRPTPSSRPAIMANMWRAPHSPTIPASKRMRSNAPPGSTPHPPPAPARHYGQHVAGPLFADDSGLEVDALNGAPGVHSARYSGPSSTDESNNRLLLEKLRNVTRRTARFPSAIALVEAGVLRGVWRGAVEGAILHDPRGDGGFGYDP